MRTQDILVDIYNKIRMEIKDVKQDEPHFVYDIINILYAAVLAALEEAGSFDKEKIKERIMYYLKHWGVKSITDDEYYAILKMVSLSKQGSKLRDLPLLLRRNHMPPRSRHYKHNPLVGRMDAGQLREHIVNRYGNILLYGGSGEQYWRMYRLIRKLVKMTRMPEKTITQHLKADAATLQENPKMKRPKWKKVMFDSGAMGNVLKTSAGIEYIIFPPIIGSKYADMLGFDVSAKKMKKYNVEYGIGITTSSKWFDSKQKAIAFFSKKKKAYEKKYIVKSRRR